MGLLHGDSLDADVIEIGMPLTTSSVPWKGTRQLMEEKGKDQMEAGINETDRFKQNGDEWFLPLLARRVLACEGQPSLLTDRACPPSTRLFCGLDTQLNDASTKFKENLNVEAQDRIVPVESPKSKSDLNASASGCKKASIRLYE